MINPKYLPPRSENTQEKNSAHKNLKAKDKNLQTMPLTMEATRTKNSQVNETDQHKGNLKKKEAVTFGAKIGAMSKANESLSIDGGDSTKLRKLPEFLLNRGCSRPRFFDSGEYEVVKQTSKPENLKHNLMTRVGIEIPTIHNIPKRKFYPISTKTGPMTSIQK